MKKRLAMTLCLMLCIPMLASAEEEDRVTHTCGFYRYVLLEDSTVEITEYFIPLVDPEAIEETTDYTNENEEWSTEQIGEVFVPTRIDGLPVTGIGDYAFSYAYDLTKVTIPDGVVNIGINPFYKCGSLQSIAVSPDHPTLATIDGVLFHKPDQQLLCCPCALTQSEYVIPQGIKTIGEIAFSDCINLTSVTLPDSLVIIKKDAFHGCGNLSSISMPDNLTTIESGAFQECESLTSITFPDSLTTIGDGTFQNCEGLTSVVLPDELTGIGNGAFAGCLGLSSITLPDDITFIGSNPFSGCLNLTRIVVSPDNATLAAIDGVLFNKQDRKLVCYPCAFTQSQYTVPQGIQTIGACAFLDCICLTAIVLPDSLISIENMAFSACTNLINTTLPDSLTAIGDWAFYDCSSLASVKLSTNLRTIGNGAFERCSSLASITIPNSVTTIGDGAFNRCSNLTRVEIPESVTSIGEVAFSNCHDDLTITVVRDSYAAEYCRENGISYTYTDSLDWLNG